MTLIENIQRHAKTNPEASALEENGRVVRYKELPIEIDQHLQALEKAGCQRLAIAGDNSLDWILWDLAAWQADIPCVPIPPFFTAAQTEFVLQSAGITHIAQGTVLRETNIKQSTNIPADTCKITFTSGSTGTPKGVCLTRTGIEAVAQSIGDVLGNEYAGRHLCVLPLSILLENVAGVYAALSMGATICLKPLAEMGMAKPFMPDFGAFLQAVDATAATSIILVPELLRGLIAEVAKTKKTPQTLKFVAVGGAKVSPEILSKAHDLGLPVYEGYGLSECASVVSLNTPKDFKTGTSGKPLPHVKVRVENGEIVVFDPAFAGYLGIEGDKPQVFPTGDLGEIDADGFITLSGRKKNIIITSFGRNVSPEWVESILLSQQGILQAVVYGDSKTHLSALIVPMLDKVDVKASIDAANNLLPEYAHIKDYEIVSPFTQANGMLTGNGRIKREFILRTYEKEKTMNFYEKLQKETSLERQALYQVPQLVDGLKGDISRETYVAYLTEAYHHVKHTVRFMMAMGARLPEEKKWLHDAIAEYIDEEKGHEEWILNDVAAAGGDKEAARRSMPNLETQVLVAYNYDYIARKNPVGFFGMVFMLESTSTQIASVGAEAIQKGLGLPKNAFTYLTSHGALDIEHMKFFEMLVNKIDDPADQAAIIEVARNTFRLFAGVLQAIPHRGAKRNAA